MDDNLTPIPDEFFIIWYKREMAAWDYSNAYDLFGGDSERTNELRTDFNEKNQQALDIYNSYVDRVGRITARRWWNIVQNHVEHTGRLTFKSVKVTNGRF